MIHLNNILVSHDFSDCSAHALDYGVELAIETDANLHFLHVEIFHEDHLLKAPSPGGKAGELREKLKADIYASVKKQGYTPADIPGIQYAVASDYSAANGINQYCVENKIDLVVMGTEGRSGMALHMKQPASRRGAGQFSLGSVAETVVRTAPCSVLTIRENVNSEPLESYLKKIIVPLNFSDTTLKTLQFALKMATFYEAKLELIHVVEGWEAPPYYDDKNILVYDQRAVENVVLEKMEHLAGEAGGMEAGVEFVVLKGDPAGEILRHAQSDHNIMIILGANAVAGHWQDGIGSTIERVVRLAGCPVLTVKPPQ